MEACRRTLRRGLKKQGKLWIRCFPWAPFTKKPIASRMGKGKGKLSHWFSPIKQGQVLFEMQYTAFSSYKSHLVLRKASSKLPVKTTIIQRIY
jgi:large subunit ribosomal protein L16